MSTLAGNQSEARERAYRDYETAQRSGSDKNTLNQLWSLYEAALAQDPGAAKASRRH